MGDRVPELRAVLDRFDRRAPDAIGRGAPARGGRVDRSGRSRHGRCAIQEGVDLGVEVPTELEVLLTEPSGLIAQPRVAEIRAGVGTSGIGGHVELQATARWARDDIVTD